MSSVVAPMDLLASEESFLFPQVKGFDKFVVGKCGLKVLGGDSFVVIIFPSTVQDVLVDGSSSPKYKDKAFAFFISGKGVSGKRRTEEVFVFC
jgi:hypothetical protein